LNLPPPVPEIPVGFVITETCLQGHTAAKNALDQVFDIYFLSCVQ
jgi:hypothetical protein